MRKVFKDYGWLFVLIILIGLFFFKSNQVTFGDPDEKKPRKVTLVNMRIVDIERIINEYSGAKSVGDQLGRLEAQYQQQCNQFRTEMQKYQRYLKKNEDKMSVEEQNKYLRAIEVKKRAYEECLKEKDSTLLQQEATLKAPILTRIYSAIQTVSQRNGYNVVVDSKTVLYHTNELDITDEILEELQ